MLRIWGKIWMRGRIRESLTVKDEHTDWTLRERIEELEEQLVREFDLPHPIWLPKNESEMQTYGATQFTQDNFVEHFPYQSFEMEIIERDIEIMPKKYLIFNQYYGLASEEAVVRDMKVIGRFGRYRAENHMLLSTDGVISQILGNDDPFRDLM